MSDLRSLVAGVLAPGFNGTSVPKWLRAAVDDGLGSVVLFGHNVSAPDHDPDVPLRQLAALCTELRGRRTDLLIASDEEGGDVTRMEVGAGSSLPGAAALGAIGDAGFTAEVAAAHGGLLRALGIDSGLAPVADVNSNPANPVIGVRSFGPDATTVAAQVVAYTEGLQSAGVLACVKHFPGHGDAGVDSHHELPKLLATIDELRRRELVPFAAAVRAGVAAVMPGHLMVPAVDQLAASVSQRWTGILRGELAFAGLIITDALDMRAVADRYGVPGAAVMALRAGADLLCLGNTAGIDDEQMYTDCVEAILAAVADGTVRPEALTGAARRRRQAMAGLASSAHPAAGEAAPVDGIAAAAAELRRIGRRAAELAIRVDPALRIGAAPAVVDLRMGGNTAAGPTSRRLPDALRAGWPGMVMIDHADRAAFGARITAMNRPVLVLVRSAAEGSAEGARLHQILQLRPDSVVVHTGWPGTPSGPRTVFSYGEAAVNARVLCERLSGPAG